MEKHVEIRLVRPARSRHREFLLHRRVIAACDANDGVVPARRDGQPVVKKVVAAVNRAGAGKVHAVYLPRPRIEIAGPQGVQATFDWQAARDSVVGRMCTATLVNDMETY